MTTMAIEQIIRDLNFNADTATGHLNDAATFIEQAKAAGNEAALKSATTAHDLAFGAKSNFRKALQQVPGSPEQLDYQRKGLDLLKQAERHLNEAAALLG